MRTIRPLCIAGGFRTRPYMPVGQLVRLWSTAKRLQVWSSASNSLFPVNGYNLLTTTARQFEK
jgi:hypothetical protein